MEYSAGDSDREDELGGTDVYICEKECSSADVTYSPRTDYHDSIVYFNDATGEEIEE